jgi:cell division GTPase FtsZ
MDIPDLEIPDLELEDYKEPDAAQEEVTDESGGSHVFAWIGSGQGGGRIAKAFHDRGYKKCIAVNTSKQDLALLDIPDNQKLLLDIGEEGAGKDMERGANATIKFKQEIFDLMRKVYGTKVDHIMVCIGAGGGSGSGSSLVLIDIAKKYMKFIGHDKPEERVGVVMSLPTRGESTSPKVSYNAYRVLKQIGGQAERKEISPLVIIDNARIEKMYSNLTVKEFWSTINNTVSGLFHIFNVLSKHPSQYTSFDPTDYATTFRCGGVMVMGVSKLNIHENKPASKSANETEISKSIKGNMDKTLLAEIDVSNATYAACCAVGGKQIMENTPGLMDNLSYGFDTLSSLCPNATFHRGIYEDDKPTLRLYTLISGLKVPIKRLDQLKLNFADKVFDEKHPFDN